MHTCAPSHVHNQDTPESSIICKLRLCSLDWYYSTLYTVEHFTDYRYHYTAREVRYLSSQVKVTQRSKRYYWESLKESRGDIRCSVGYRIVREHSGEVVYEHIRLTQQGAEIYGWRVRVWMVWSMHRESVEEELRIMIYSTGPLDRTEKSIMMGALLV
ncbi:hypothetical protein Tco_0233496 [Tanacetum coccineum]